MGDSQSFEKMDLTTLFLSISSAAFMALGGHAEGEPSEPVDLDLARQNIELLELLAEKTQGNRSGEEDQLLEQLLSEVRLKYVELQASRR